VPFLPKVLGFLGPRAVPIGASAVVHAAVLFTAVGHPAAARGEAEAGVAEVDVTGLEPAPLEEERAPQPQREEEHEASHSAHRSHTHPYPVPASHDWTPHDRRLVHVFAPPSLPTGPHEASPAPDVPAATEDPPHFAITVGGGGSHAPAGAPNAPSAVVPLHGESMGEGERASRGEASGEPVPEQSVSTPARLASGGAPAYPPEARALGVEASVALDLVVSASGAVETARALRRAGHGLDEAAIAAVRGYRFVPATRGGRAVRVRMRWVMQFELR
jgi:protein TonB